MSERYKPALAYNILTPLYDRINESLGFGKIFSRKVLQIADLKKGEKVLDVGMGTGTLIAEALIQYPELGITGIDPDNKVIQQAQYKLEGLGLNAEMVKGYAQKMPFQDKSFDVVISTLVFHHLPTNIKKLALKEILRVLKDDGRFLLADFGKPQTIVSNVLLNIGSLFDGRENMRVNLSGKLQEYLRTAGFTVEEAAQRYRGVQFLLARK